MQKIETIRQLYEAIENSTLGDGITATGYSYMWLYLDQMIEDSEKDYSSSDTPLPDWFWDALETHANDLTEWRHPLAHTEAERKDDEVTRLDRYNGGNEILDFITRYREEFL